MLAACSSAPGDFAECPDAACRQFLVVEAWKGGPESVGHLLAQVEDEVELTVIMNRLRETYPDETTGLCDFLPEGLTRQRCHRIHSRPHLEGVEDCRGSEEGPDRRLEGSPSEEDGRGANCDGPVGQKGENEHGNHCRDRTAFEGV